ncbi:hypothetical protein AO1008_04169 [Aspergillus oryzae 100-8]|uniref:Uncharacterized protein n=1 Tax=Aspergillus oryzae (strain 3.042) TaxID=1160506 RepID=I8ADD0_ASPO3|nr:hypothetical protein Ao3042_05152 [Aspergillus oryzae 3.042]KDE78093.1 hypothetical protein AO1008_04169 [Aspergillus oryzae 100-8]|eukprot:EIT83527.1 hypothetical protein Ao3042_05152 [Aspergillus oryzae 3.042]
MSGNLSFYRREGPELTALFPLIMVGNRKGLRGATSTLYEAKRARLAEADPGITAPATAGAAGPPAVGTPVTQHISGCFVCSGFSIESWPLVAPPALPTKNLRTRNLESI